MNNSNTKTYKHLAGWALGLSIVAILLCITIIALWFFQVIEFSVVDSNTFIGVIVALLAIIVTIILGWQIYNSIDVKSQISEIQDIRTELRHQRFDIDDDFYYMMQLHGKAFGEIAINNGKYDEAFDYYLSVLYYQLKGTSKRSYKELFDKLQDIIQQVKTISLEVQQNVTICDEEIRKHYRFKYIEHSYSKIFKKYQEKVNTI